MKNLLPIALVLLSVTACNNKSAVSTSGIENKGMSTYNPLLIPKGSETGVKCVLATQTERREILVQGIKEGSNNITLHDLSGMDNENRDLYLETFSLLGRTVPAFELSDEVDKKDKFTKGRTQETVRILINDEFEDETNPDKVRPGMIITGIKYKLNLPNNQDVVGDISRAYVYEKTRGLFNGKTGDWKVIADLDDCHAVNAQPKKPMKKSPRN